MEEKGGKRRGRWVGGGGGGKNSQQQGTRGSVLARQHDSQVKAAPGVRTAGCMYVGGCRQGGVGGEEVMSIEQGRCQDCERPSMPASTHWPGQSCFRGVHSRLWKTGGKQEGGVAPGGRRCGVGGGGVSTQRHRTRGRVLARQHHGQVNAAPGVRTAGCVGVCAGGGGGGNYCSNNGMAF
jgi:hypothetical protein